MDAVVVGAVIVSVEHWRVRVSVGLSPIDKSHSIDMNYILWHCNLPINPLVPRMHLQ